MPDAHGPLRIGGTEVHPGTEARLELPVARLFAGTWLALPVWVMRGGVSGPRLWLDAAIHGDELNGMEIIRQVFEELDPAHLSGTLLAVPVVNIFGFVQGARYLPDRRDLNRCFPGSASGSLASRLAHIFMTEIVGRCQFGIDLHTGSHHRSNLPQIRANLRHEETRRLATAFGAPLMYDAPVIGGSLRAVARRRGIPLLVYEAGEPLRFDADAIGCGLHGIQRVMHALGMSAVSPPPTDGEPFVAGTRRWVRAGRSGIFRAAVSPGARVERHETLGTISDLFTHDSQPVRAPFAALVVGATRTPLVHSGDALLHLAREA